MRLSDELCEGSSTLDTFATSDVDQLLQLPETTTTIESKVSNSSSSLLKIPLALLIKLTNYFTVRDFHNYTLVSRRLSTIMGRLEFVEANHWNDSLSKGTRFAMTRTLPKRLEISLALAFGTFYDNLLAMATTLENLTLLSDDFKDIDNSMIEDQLRERIRDNDEQSQEESSSLKVVTLPSFPKLRSLTLKKCLGSTQLFDLFNMESLTHLAIGDESSSCEDNGCPFHIYQEEGKDEDEAESQEWLHKLSGLQSLSLTSSEPSVGWRYSSLTNFPSLTKLQLHIESNSSHQCDVLNELDQLPELTHLDLEFVVEDLEDYSDTCDCLDVLPRIKKLRTLDFNLQLKEASDNGRLDPNPMLRLIMEKIGAAGQITSLGLMSDSLILQNALYFLAPKTEMGKDAESKASVFVGNLRELRLESKLSVLCSQNEVFAMLDKFTALTSLKTANLLPPTKDFKGLRQLRELDFNSPDFVFTSNYKQAIIDWMQTFSATLVKIKMPPKSYLREVEVKQYIETITAMPLVREIVLSPSFLLAPISLRHFFVNELRRLRPEIQFSSH